MISARTRSRASFNSCGGALTGPFLERVHDVHRFRECGDVEHAVCELRLNPDLSNAWIGPMTFPPVQNSQNIVRLKRLTGKPT